jgi:hypothetical protein
VNRSVTCGKPSVARDAFGFTTTSRHFGGVHTTNLPGKTRNVVVARRFVNGVVIGRARKLNCGHAAT